MKKSIIVWAGLICTLVLFQNCSGDETDINNVEEYEEYIQDEMEIQNIPAMSVHIFREDEILYEKFLGKSDREGNIDLKNDHLFLLASVSKVVTATALLQLYDADKFDLDDNINDYLPFEVSVPNQTTPVTFRMLLTHTSGIADGSALDGQYYYGEDSPVALDYFLENYLVPGGACSNSSENFYDFEPGTRHEYSNEGSALTAVLVEQIAGKDFNTYCKENIFEPLGMMHTFWRLDEAAGAGRTIVRPYNFEDNEFEAIPHYTFTDYPNGGLRATGRDMFTFLSAFAKGGMTNNYRLLKSTTIDEMITPQIPSIESKMGLHMFLLDVDNTLWGHDGGEAGVATIMAFNPTTKVGAIILTNQGDADLDKILVESYKLGVEL